MKVPDVNTTLPTRVKRLFYLVSPSESMFKTLDEVPNYVSESFVVFELFLVLEVLVLCLQGKPLPRISDAITSFGAGIISRLPSLLMKGIEVLAYCWIWDNYRVYELPWDSAWTWVFCMVGVDFCYYWVHRFAHEVNFMWAAHQVHHSSEDYNLSTALRQSVLQAYNSWVFYLPLAFIAPPSMFLVHSQFNLLYQFWIHTEAIGWLGPLEYIINTPSAHRVHHGRNRYCIDKNYGGTLIIFDIIFGTYAAERSGEDKVVYGLVHPIESRNPFYVQLCHWQYMIETAAYNRKGLLNKVLTFLYGPGWEPGKPRMGEITDIPDIKHPQPKYENTTPAWYSGYALLHFFVVSLLNKEIHEKQATMDVSLVVLSILFILLTLTCIGSLYDQRSYGPLIELLRCASVSAFIYKNQVLFGTSTLPLAGVFVCSTALYTFITLREVFARGKATPTKTDCTAAKILPAGRCETSLDTAGAKDCRLMYRTQIV